MRSTTSAPPPSAHQSAPPTPGLPRESYGTSSYRAARASAKSQTQCPPPRPACRHAALRTRPTHTPPSLDQRLRPGPHQREIANRLRKRHHLRLQRVLRAAARDDREAYPRPPQPTPPASPPPSPAPAPSAQSPSASPPAIPGSHPPDAAATGSPPQKNRNIAQRNRHPPMM